MNEEYDIVEMDFPDYEEPYPPFPDVKVALFDKDSSYSRNRDIADRLYADRQKEEDRRREERRRAELKKMERLNPAALRPKSKAAKIIPAAAAVLAITAMVATSLTSGGNLTPDIVDMKSATGSYLYATEKAEFTVLTEMSPYSTYINKLDIDLSANGELRIHPKNFYIRNGQTRYHMGVCTVTDGIPLYSDGELEYVDPDPIGNLNLHMECRIEKENYYDGIFGYDDGSLNFEIPLKELLEDKN